MRALAAGLSRLSRLSRLSGFPFIANFLANAFKPAKPHNRRFLGVFRVAGDLFDPQIVQSASNAEVGHYVLNI